MRSLLLVAVAAIIVASAGGASIAVAAPSATTLNASLSGLTEIPPVVTSATGSATVVLNDPGDMITVDVSYQNLTSSATAAHIHHAPAGMSGGIVFDLGPVPGGTSGTIPQRQFAISPDQRSQLLAGHYYVNVHTINNGGGEIRGQIGNQTLTATLSGINEVPPVVTTGTGSGTVVLNHAQDTITVDVSYQNLTSAAIAAHIHDAPAGMNGGVIFDLGPVPGGTSGTIPQRTFAISPAQVARLMGEQYYINVHTTNNAGGEIRGQVQPPDNPTAVRIRRASATRTHSGVLVRWSTAFSAPTLGFNLYRLRAGSLVRLNRSLIPTAAGERYSWLDRSAPRGKVRYRIQAVDARGLRTWVASVSARA